VRRETIRRVEFVAAMALSILAIVFLIARATHAGGLWRDEADTVTTATLPFPDLLRYFQFDALPLSFLIGLRGYVAIAGNTDASLRIFGVLVGLGLLLAGWWSARRLRDDVPLVFLTLAVLNPAFLIWGTTIRGYGLGSVMAVLAFAATANFLRQNKTRDAVLMALAFVAAVQCLVSNTALVFAISLGAMSICWWRGERRSALIVGGALGLAALSFLPYLTTYSKTGWRVVLQTNASLAALLSVFCDSLGANKPLTAVAWIFFTLLAAILMFRNGNRPILSVYSALVGLFAFAGICSFLKLLSYIPQQWYFVPLVCVLAATLDLIVSAAALSTALRAVRLVLCIAAAGVMCWSSWPALTARQTNVDLVANWLGQNARANDLLIVNPWFAGVSFNRYYRGTAPWITVPMMNDRAIHRYDLLQEKMSENDPLKEIRARIESTLRGGGSVYLIGGAHWLENNEHPMTLAPAPNSKYGWSLLPYIVAWSQQIAEFLQAHMESGVAIPPLDDHVNPEEDVPLWQARGWRD
jgi:hypothetical protein